MIWIEKNFNFYSTKLQLFWKPPDNLRNYHYLDTMVTTLLHFSTDECLGNQISNGEYLFYYQTKSWNWFGEILWGVILWGLVWLVENIWVKIMTDCTIRITTPQKGL